MTSRTPAALAIALGLAGAAVARADGPAPPEDIPAKARALAAKGRAAHDAGDYPTAVDAFQQAYVIAPSSALLFNLAQAYRLMGDCDDATLMYRRFLATGPSPEARAIAEGHLETTERCDPSVRAAAKAKLAASQQPKKTTASRGARTEKISGIVLAVGGLAALGATTYYGLEARSAANDVSDAYANGAKWSDVKETNERGEHDARMAQIFGIGGGVALAAGATLYYLGRRSERAMPVAIAPTKRGAQVSLSWDF